MATKIYYYTIVDCEHEGDIRSAEYEVTKAGGEVLSTYWNGKDCGDAYISFTAPDDKINTVCNELGYDADELYRYTKE